MHVPNLCFHILPVSLVPSHCSNSTLGSYINLLVRVSSINMALPSFRSLPLLFVGHVYLAVMISLSCKRGLPWLKHQSLLLLSLHFETESSLGHTLFS